MYQYYADWPLTIEAWHL